MKRIYSVLVENRSGVLCKVAGLFSRRCFNIDSLAVGETDDHAVSCMTIVSSGDERTLEQIEKQVRKMEDVIDIKFLNDSNSVFRELMMIKLRVGASERAEVVSVADIFRAKVVNVEKDCLIIELTGTESKLEAFLSLLDGYEILELARTGITGLSRGSKDVAFF